jgi:hypothetical protein
MVYRIPGEVRELSQTFADHVASGALGALDFPDDRETVMRAQGPGVVTAVDNNPSGAEGRMVTVRYDDGNLLTEAHALSITITRGTRVEWGTPMGSSAGSGFDEDFFYGPHIHNAAFNRAGERFDHESLIQFSSTAFAGAVPIEEFGESDMAQFKIGTASRHFGVGQRILLPASGPFTVAGIGQADGFPDSGPAKPGEWAEQLLVDRGMWEFVNNGTLSPGPLTGRILGGPSGTDASGEPRAAFPRVAGPELDAAALAQKIVDSLGSRIVSDADLEAAKRAILDAIAAVQKPNR